jgi:hypothetical protein
VLTIRALKGQHQIVAGINNRSLDITIPTRGFEDVKYSILNKDIMKGEIVLMLNFSDP